jgi:hypothetical protein
MDNQNLEFFLKLLLRSLLYATQSPLFNTQSKRYPQSHERDKRLCDRIKTILLLDKGRTYEVIAEDLTSK